MDVAAVSSVESHEGNSSPWLSIVIAARRAEGDLDACLAALTPQIDGEVEVIVVLEHPRRSPLPEGVAGIVSGRPLVPQLWSEGVKRARGKVVGLLASTGVPGDDWVRRTREAHGAGVGAVGGPIEPALRISLVDTAIYLCRYTPHLRPLLDPSRIEVAADNASYTRDALLLHAALWDDGFWEPFVHHALRSDGQAVEMRDDRLISYIGGGSAGDFARQRFRHGRAHGRLWAQGRSAAKVLQGVATEPLVPLVMVSRVVRTLRAKRRSRLSFVLAMPLVLWFYCWWAAGELVGRLQHLLAGGER